MKNTGVWSKVELDDEGNLSVVVHAAQEWQEGETVTVGETVTDSIPKELVDELKMSMNKIIDASKDSMIKMAKDAALEMADVKLGKNRKKKLSLDFSGSMKQEGKVNA